MALLQKRKPHEATALLASAARTGTGNGDSVRLQSMVNGFAFTLIVSDAANAAGDTLDVYVQTKSDQTNWTDVVHFTQVTGNAGAVRHLAKLTGEIGQIMFEVGSALAAGSIRNCIGDEWRVRWEVTDLSGSASFTFGVLACPE